MTVIELGELSSGEKDETPAPVHLNLRLVRRVGVALAAVLCALTVTGSAPIAEPRGLRVLWSTPLDQQEQTVITTGSVYTVFLESTRILTARNLDDGAVRWRRQLPAPLHGVELFERAGVLLVPAERQGKGDGGTYYDEYTTETVALDPGTGAELWRRPGAVTLVDAQTALFTRQNPSGRFLTSVSVVQLRDGSLVWSRPTAGAERLVTDAAERSGPGRIVTVTPAGRVDVFRYADGARLAAGAVEWPVQPADAEGYTDVRAQGGMLFVTLIGATEATVIGYDTDTLRRLWRVEHITTGGVMPCGTALCGSTSSGVVALDGRTGEIRWQNGEIPTAWPIGAGRLLTDTTDDTPQFLLDDETGRVIAELGPGYVVPEPTDTTAYLLRPTRSPAGRVSISRMDLRTGATAMRGAIAQIDGTGCSATVDRLLCPTPDGRLIIMAVG